MKYISNKSNSRRSWLHVNASYLKRWNGVGVEPSEARCCPQVVNLKFVLQFEKEQFISCN